MDQCKTFWLWKQNLLNCLACTNISNMSWRLWELMIERSGVQGVLISISKSIIIYSSPGKIIAYVVRT
ncbi:hypothetical protein M5K25_011750 [Dendrobium thyrsiflorum]|uniref:Uncharacterized protein n=1 Tax=Dendrobium thyrsiflorum TaxID=117978 RepID=A0ABD0V4E9_DENTH